jgi:hypothetical protein
MTRDTAANVSRPIIQLLTVLNLLYATGITILLIASLVLKQWLWKALGFEGAGMDLEIPMALRTIAVIGIVGAAIVHTILRRLLAIVDSVRDGDPFVADNAVRLREIAWRVLVLELLRLAVHAIAETVLFAGNKIQLGATISFTPWLAVLLLFVLAGVFAQGTRMRADLEGTV